MEKETIERTFPKLEGEEELQVLLKLYIETKDFDVFSRIVEICYPIIDFVLDSPKYKNYDKNVLASYASSGLIKAICDCECFDINNLKISIYRNVFSYARNGISEITGLPIGFKGNFDRELKNIDDSLESNTAFDFAIIEKILDNLLKNGSISKDCYKYYLNKVLTSSTMIQKVDDNLFDSHLIDYKSLDYLVYLKELRKILYKMMDKCCTDLQKESIKRYFGFYFVPAMAKDEEKGSNVNYDSVIEGIRNIRKYLGKNQSSFIKKGFIENVDINGRDVSFNEQSSCFLGITEEEYFAKKKVRK